MQGICPARLWALAGAEEFEIFAQVVSLEDQPLFDYIFKNVRLGNDEVEAFIDQYIKSYLNWTFKNN